MTSWTGWNTSRSLVAEHLKQAFGRRQKDGRDEAKARRREIERLRKDGHDERADQLEDIAWKKSWAFARRLRRREEFEAQRDGRRLRAALKRTDRLNLGASSPGRLYRHFEYGAGGIGEALFGSPRELFFEWIPRGFKSGSSKAYKREVKRSNARSARWKSGEFGRKIRYIERTEALEKVEGNVISSMGEDMAERVACSRQIEQLESADRENAGVYRHVIVALPHELSSEGRARLLTKLVEPLRDMGLPFDAALHKPDREGDQRNFHAHILVSLRPMRRLGDHDWAFAAFKRRSLETPGGLKLQRRYIARCFNRALAAERIATRWTHLSRADRDLPSPGNTKMYQSEVKLSRSQAAADREVENVRREAEAVAAAGDEVERLDAQRARLDRTEDRFAGLVEEMLAEATMLRKTSSETLGRLDRIEASIEHAVREVESRGLEPGSGSQPEIAGEAEEALPAPELITEPGAAMREAERARLVLQGEDGGKRDRRRRVPIDFGAWFDPTLPHRLGERRRANHDALVELELDGRRALTHRPAFKTVSAAFLRAEPQFFVRTQASGEQRLYTRDAALLDSFRELIREVAYRTYLRTMVDASPKPPTGEIRTLHHIIVRPARQAPEPTSLETAAPIEVTEEDEGYSVVEQHLARTGLKPGKER